MAQFGRPISDIAFNLLGGTPVNTAGNRYQNIDEASFSDTDYIYSQNNPGGGSSSEFGLTALTDPNSSTGHILRIRTAQIDEDSGPHPQSANTSGTATSLTWELRQGVTVIASGSINPAAFTTTSYTLSGAEADSITDYTNLEVSINASGGGGSPASRRAVAVSWIEFEVPDVATPTEVLPSVGVLVVTGLASVITAGVGAIVGLGALSILGFATSVTVSDNIQVNPDVGIVTIEGFAPTWSSAPTGAPFEAFPINGDIILDGFNPAVETPRNIATDVGSISLNGFEPTISTPTEILPDVGIITLVGLEPTFSGGANIAVFPEVGVVTLTGFEPIIQTPLNINIDVGDLTLNGFVPTVFASDNKELLPDTGILVFTGFEVRLSNNVTINPSTGDISIIGFNPVVFGGDNKLILPDLGLLIINGFAPVVNQVIILKLLSLNSVITKELTLTSELQPTMDLDSIITKELTLTSKIV